MKGQEESRIVFDLLLETLYLIEEMDRGMQDIPVLFRAKVAFEQGYRPDFHCCSGCGASQGTFDKPLFSLKKAKFCVRNA